MKLRSKKTGEVVDFKIIADYDDCTSGWRLEKQDGWILFYDHIDEIHEEWEDYKPAEPLIKDEKIRKAVRAWAEAENCTREMNLYYTLNRQEKYITFHNPQTGSELQLCDFDSPVFQEIREYTIAELCGEEEWQK